MPKYSLNCPPLPTTPRIARDFVTSVLRALELDPLVDDATLCTSELVTNSCVHPKGSGGALLLLDADDYDSAVRVTVYDRDRTPPSLREGYDAESGRGLWIVDTVTEGRWGTGRQRVIRSPRQSRSSSASGRSPCSVVIRLAFLMAASRRRGPPWSATRSRVYARSRAFVPRPDCPPARTDHPGKPTAVARGRLCSAGSVS